MDFLDVWNVYIEIVQYRNENQILLLVVSLFTIIKQNNILKNLTSATRGGYHGFDFSVTLHIYIYYIFIYIYIYIERERESFQFLAKLIFLTETTPLYLFVFSTLNLLFF